MFFDFNMFEMDGYEVLEYVWQEDFLILIIVVFGDIQLEVWEWVCKLGVIDFIKKLMEVGIVMGLFKDYGLYSFSEFEDMVLNDIVFKNELFDFEFVEILVFLNDYFQEIFNVVMG